MKKQLNYLFAAFCAGLFLTSCASLTGFEEGRTLGESVNEIGVSANYTSVPDLFGDDVILDDSLGVPGSIGFPNIELNYKRGITDKLDIGFRTSTALNSGAYLKYQVVGDKSSSFALSPGLELGTVLGAAYSVGIPVYASFYPTDNFTINVNPRFTYQFFTGAESSGAAYFGGNVGLMFGRKNKFGLDVGYYNVGLGDSSSSSLLTFGLGGRFRFGGDSGGGSRRR